MYLIKSELTAILTIIMCCNVCAPMCCSVFTAALCCSVTTATHLCCSVLQKNHCHINYVCGYMSDRDSRCMGVHT